MKIYKFMKQNYENLYYKYAVKSAEYAQQISFL